MLEHLMTIGFKTGFLLGFYLISVENIKRDLDARFKSEALCIRGFPYYNEPPQQPISKIIIYLTY